MDYDNCKHTLTRDSVRSIIIRGGQIAMIHSQKFDYYKFPGGGIEKGETPIDAMIRETAEEAWLIVIRESVREYGFVNQIQKSDINPAVCFIQKNYYYTCNAMNGQIYQNLEEYESNEGYHLLFVKPL